MRKIIIISGSVGTGKTTLAKYLADKYTLKYIDVNNIISGFGISEGYDYKRKAKIIDTDKLNLILIDKIKNFKEQKTSKYKGMIIDSHLSHYLPSHFVDHCIITKCDIQKLKKRLEARGYDDEKVRENLDAEIFDVCRVEAWEAGHDVFTVHTAKKKRMDQILKEYEVKYFSHSTGGTA